MDRILSIIPPKADAEDFLGRFREVVSDPLNLLIERDPMAGTVVSGDVCLHNGIHVPVAGDGAYYGSFSQLLIINRGVHEPLEEFVFQELLKTLPTAPTMIELGAYWAHYSMWLKKHRPQARVILVEPDPKNLSVGLNNFKRNSFDCEYLQSFVGRGHFEIDRFFSTQLLSRLDILHVDIQGYEVELLEGGKKTFEQHQIDYLFISTHSQAIHAHIVAELGRIGYRVEISSDLEKDTTSLDGFVFASSPQAKQIFKDFPLMGRRAIAESSPDTLLQSLLQLRNQSR